MRLGIVTELFYPHVGGQEIRYFDFCQELIKLGHEVNVFTVRYNKRLPSTERLGEAAIHRYAFSPNYVREMSRSIVGVLNYSVQTGIRISRLPPFDAVIFNQWPLIPVLFSERLCRATTIVDWCEPWPNGVISTLQKAISHFPDGHTTVSDHIRLWLIRNYNMRPEKVKSIPSAIKTSLYKSNPKDKTIGKIVYIGRLAKHKRLDVLVEAVRIARKECPEMTLDIIGPGPMRKMLQKRIHSDDSFIKIHGFLSENEKIRHLKKAWMLTILSEREGFPRVVAEALAAGTPIITSNSPENGTKNIVKETRAGIVCSPSPQEVADTLIELYHDENHWKALSRNASESAFEFDISEITKKLVTFIQDLSGVN